MASHSTLRETLYEAILVGQLAAVEHSAGLAAVAMERRCAKPLTPSLSARPWLDRRTAVVYRSRDVSLCEGYGQTHPCWRPLV